jgi:hypothetical protein
MRSRDILHKAKGPLRSEGTQDDQAGEAGVLVIEGQESQN